MLFDLRGRGRRRAVQAIYLGLAILMGGGLVLFGIGGATSGGLLDAFKCDGRDPERRRGLPEARRQGRGGASRPARRTRRLGGADARALPAGRQRRRLRPATRTSSPTRARRAAQAADGMGQATSTLTKKPDDTVASLMVQAFSTAGSTSPTRRSRRWRSSSTASPDRAAVRPAGGAGLPGRPDPQGRARVQEGRRADAQGRPGADPGPARRRHVWQPRRPRPPRRPRRRPSAAPRGPRTASGKPREAAPSTTSSLSCPTPPL